MIALPAVFLHGYQYVEGLTVAIARGAIKDGHWLTPYIYNLRWVERPTLLSWVIAGISLPVGDVNPFTARLPIIVSLLAGCLLIWRALLPIASAGAALLGAALFLACPVVLRYGAMSSADMPLAVILFGAFLLWWNSFLSGRVSVQRWVLIGGLLALAALLKGPQPVAYFLLGIGVFSLLTSAWWQIPGLALAGLVAAVPTALWYVYVFVPGDQNEWLRYTRLSSGSVIHPRPFKNAVSFFFEAFPAALLAGALLVSQYNSSRNSVASEKIVPPKFVLAVACYALTSTLIILVWPAQVMSRYVLPMTLPLCVLGGLAYDALSQRWPRLVASGICITVAILGYAAVHFSVEQLLRPEKYRLSQIASVQIADFIRAEPAPLYRIDWNTGQNEVAYMPNDIVHIEPTAVATLPKPAWILVPEADIAAMVAKSDGHLTSRLVFDRAGLLRLQ